MSLPALSDQKPPEPNEPEYLEKAAAARERVAAKDYEGAKAIYTELLHNPDYRNAVVYSNRSYVNLKLDLPFSAYHDSTKAAELCGERWRKVIFRNAEAARALNLHKVAARCYAAIGQHEDAEAARGRQMEQFLKGQRLMNDGGWDRAIKSEKALTGVAIAPQQDFFQTFAAYRLRPQIPRRDPGVIAQRIDEIHAKHPKVRVKDAPGMGRGLFAACAIERGETILIENPLVAGFIDGDRCQQCFRELLPTAECPTPPTAVPCDGCGIERYCGDDCRELAWGLYHRVQCRHASKLQALRDFQKTGSTHTAITPLVIARLVGMTMCSPLWPCHTLSLPPMQLLSPSGRQPYMDASDLFHRRRRVVDALACDDDPHFDAEWFEAVSSVLMNNCFAIPRDPFFECELGGSKVGVGLFPTASLLNHSCDPNSTWEAGLYEGNDYAFNSMRIIATKAIPAGEQIFTAYIPTHHEYSLRTRVLRKYGFECKCPKCRIERQQPTPSTSL